MTGFPLRLPEHLKSLKLGAGLLVVKISRQFILSGTDFIESMKNGSEDWSSIQFSYSPSQRLIFKHKTRTPVRFCKYVWDSVSYSIPASSWDCIEFIYCQHYPATGVVISKTLPLWNEEWQYTSSSRNGLENTPPRQFAPLGPRYCPRASPSGNVSGLRGRIFQYTEVCQIMYRLPLTLTQMTLKNLFFKNAKRTGPKGQHTVSAPFSKCLNLSKNFRSCGKWTYNNATLQWGPWVALQ